MAEAPPPGIGAKAGLADAASPAQGPTEVDCDYNRLPYPSMPFSDTQPAHLGALAALFGIAAPDVERARVLELGCAAGGNIIPLAARFPKATFTGIDLSRRHIDDGRARVAALALANVGLRQANLATLDLAGEQFDYVICNGVFSWVPGSTQEAIFRLCRETLSPDGMATISYNVLPGWHLRMVIRDLCLHYAGSEFTPHRRVARARAALAKIAQVSDAGEPYGLLLRSEARRLANVPAAYILGEFLAPDNAPCTVLDFIRRAGTWGFDYLCEVDLHAAVPPTLDPSLHARLTDFAGSDRAALEQHIDFLTGRLFRRSVLVRQQLPATACIPLADRLRALHVSSPTRLDPAQSDDRRSVFIDEHRQPITVLNPDVSAAIARLGSAFPATVGMDELTARVAGEPDGGATMEVRIREAVFALVLAGRASIAVRPLRLGKADDMRPKAWSVARIEAASGQPWMTSLRHTGVPAHPVLTSLLPHLDGKNDHAALRSRFKAALQAGMVQVPEVPPDQPPPPSQRLDTIVQQYVAWALDHLARHALLEAAPGGAQ
jgi:SAM-dependent methyltransferase